MDKNFDVLLRSTCLSKEITVSTNDVTKAIAEKITLSIPVYPPMLSPRVIPINPNIIKFAIMYATYNFSCLFIIYLPILI